MSDNKSSLTLSFPTPIWTSSIFDSKKLNALMLEYILDLEKQDPKGIKKSNTSGWHSKSFKLENKEPKNFTKNISPYINNALNDMGWNIHEQEIKITNMWSIINRAGGSNDRHIHSNNYLSAAYYVKAKKNCGNIIFYDPRSVATFRYPKISKPNKLNSNIISITPQEGLLVLFPSYLYHSVDINNSKQDRIVISFNIDLTLK